MAFTETEKAQLRDHLGWSNGLYYADYVHVYVNPVLDQIDDAAKESVIRGHLTRLNNIYDELDNVVSKFKLDGVKGIEFNNRAEARLWATYERWVNKLAASMDLQKNPRATTGRARRIV